MNQSDLLHIVKTAISQGRFDAAIKPLEQILTLLKFDFDNGIDREKNGKAYNALLKVRKECIAGVLSSESYRILRLDPPRKEEPKPEPAPEPKPEPKPEPLPYDEIVPTPEPEPQPKPGLPPRSRAGCSPTSTSLVRCSTLTASRAVSISKQPGPPPTLSHKASAMTIVVKLLTIVTNLVDSQQKRKSLPQLRGTGGSVRIL